MMNWAQDMPYLSTACHIHSTLWWRAIVILQPNSQNLSPQVSKAKTIKSVCAFRSPETTLCSLSTRQIQSWLPNVNCKAKRLQKYPNPRDKGGTTVENSSVTSCASVTLTSPPDLSYSVWSTILNLEWSAPKSDLQWKSATSQEQHQRICHLKFLPKKLPPVQQPCIALRHKVQESCWRKERTKNVWIQKKNESLEKLSALF